MDTQEYCDTKERELPCESSIQLVYSLPLPEGPKSDPEEDFDRIWSPEALRNLELMHSKDFRQMDRRSRRLERRTEADLDPLTTPSLEDPEKDASSPDMSLYSSQHCGSSVLNPAQGLLGEESSSSPGNLLANLQIPTITFSVDRQPPAEVRTGYTLPAIVVNLKRSQAQTDDSGMKLDDSSLWGQASLVCAEGRVAMAQSRANILTGGSLVAPLFRSPFHMGDDNRWSLIFTGLVICEPGYFKIHIALIGASQNEGQGHGSPVVDAPTEQLSVDTSLFRVHAFAPALRNTGKHLLLWYLILSK